MTMAVERLHEARAAVKQVAEAISGLRVEPFIPEAMANVTLAYRHLEDASMRLGKAIQATDGGVSVYDQSTAVMT